MTERVNEIKKYVKLDPNYKPLKFNTGKNKKEKGKTGIKRAYELFGLLPLKFKKQQPS